MRGLSDKALADLVGTDADTIRHWEYRGYDPTALCAFALAGALRAPVDAIAFGRYLRGIVLPNYQFLLAARGRDDLGWKARVAEWRCEGRRDDQVAARATAGWLEAGPSAALALKRLEQTIRVALGDPEVAEMQEAS